MTDIKKPILLLKSRPTCDATLPAIIRQHADIALVFQHQKEAIEDSGRVVITQLKKRPVTEQKLEFGFSSQIGRIVPHELGADFGYSLVDDKEPVNIVEPAKPLATGYAITCLTDPFHGERP